MPVDRHSVEGFKAFKEKVAELDKAGKTVIVLFSGSKDDKGKSWCPDCEVAAPVVDKVLETVKEDGFAFLYVGVGGRDFWKDPDCVFRKDSSTQLKSVPTLIKWGTKERLEEDQCAKEDLVKLMFEEE